MQQTFTNHHGRRTRGRERNSIAGNMAGTPTGTTRARAGRASIPATTTTRPTRRAHITGGGGSRRRALTPGGVVAAMTGDTTATTGGTILQRAGSTRLIVQRGLPTNMRGGMDTIAPTTTATTTPHITSSIVTTVHPNARAPWIDTQMAIHQPSTQRSQIRFGNEPAPSTNSWTLRQRDTGFLMRFPSLRNLC